MSRCGRTILGLAAAWFATTCIRGPETSCAGVSTARVQDQDRSRFERLEERWRAWLEAERQEYADFRAAVEAQWGDFVASSRHRWVHYAPAMVARSIIDFRSGAITVEALSEAEEPDVARRRLAEELRRVIGSTTGEPPDAPDVPAEPSPESALAGQIIDRHGDLVTPDDASEFASEATRRHKVESTRVRTPDGRPRVKHSVTVRLVPDHLRVRAERFVPLVRKMAATYELDTRLVLAIIHTESFFNPRAVSPAPAYGLMQLVPHHGGAEAYEDVHGRAWAPTPSYLYVPRNNVELGCAYLRILLDRYLDAIANPTSRLYCAICAYNTGPANVARVFSGDGQRREAWREVNLLGREDVLASLKTRLPHEETRDYIARVLERMPLYEEWADGYQ
jgi:membrane-bound lytic murein transglycosylase C